MTISISAPNFKNPTQNTSAGADRIGCRRYRHQLLGTNGLGTASKFAKNLRAVAPQLYARAWS